MSEKHATSPDVEKWLAARRSQLKVDKTTTTPHGHKVDCVPVESQTKEKIATPPSDSRPSGAQEPKTPTKHATLDEPEAGPKGHVPILLPDLSKISKTTTLQNFLNKGRREAKSKDVPGEPNPAGYFHATKIGRAHV